MKLLKSMRIGLLVMLSWHVNSDFSLSASTSEEDKRPNILLFQNLFGVPRAALLITCSTSGAIMTYGKNLICCLVWASFEETRRHG